MTVKACVLVRAMLLQSVMLLLGLSGTVGQKDCTGVDCPVLENCIEESLPSGACCATCVQVGCACQGYQYYDCVNAGFQKGKVPEGESYFVDFGSTECSCPEGGGRISCHFIPCPDIPANCIELSEPADGCIQCKRVGCEHHGQKYEAGHTFQMDPCQVCHCPNDGGSLMCYPIPDCDASKIVDPMLTTSTREENAPHNPLQFIFQHQGPRDHVSKPLRPGPGDSLPFFPHLMNNLEDEEEEEEEEEMDYDYMPMPTDTPGPPLQDLAAPTEPSIIISATVPESLTPRVGLHRNRKQELREKFAVHHELPRHRAETTQSPPALAQTTSLHHGEVTTRSWLKGLENQVFPLDTAGAADGGTGGSDGVEDEEGEEGEEEEEAVEEEEGMPHAFPVFPQSEHLQPPFTANQPPFTDAKLKQRVRVKPVPAERGGLPDRRNSQDVETRPWMPDRTSFTDREYSQPTLTRPGFAEGASFTDSDLTQATDTRVRVPERSSVADRGQGQATQIRPLMPEISSAVDRGQTRPDLTEISTVRNNGQRAVAHSRPVHKKPETNSFADRGRSQATLTRHGLPERNSFPDNRQSAASRDRPVKPEINNFGERGHNTQPLTRQGIPEIGSFGDREQSQGTQSRPAVPKTNGFTDSGRSQGTQTQRAGKPEVNDNGDHRHNQPVVPEGGAGSSVTTLSRPEIANLDDHEHSQGSHTLPEVPGISSFDEHSQRSQGTHTGPGPKETDRDDSIFADSSRNRSTPSRTGMGEADQDRDMFAEEGRHRNTQSRPIPEELDLLKETVSDHDGIVLKKPVPWELGLHSDTGSEHEHSIYRRPIPVELDQNSDIVLEHESRTHSSPIVEALDQFSDSFSEHGRNKPEQIRPGIGSEKATSGRGNSKATQTRPVINELDRDKATSSEHARDKPALNRPVLDKFNIDRVTSSEHGRGKATQTRPVTEVYHPDKGNVPQQGISRDAQGRPFSVVQTERDKSIFTNPEEGRNSQTVSEDARQKAKQGHSSGSTTSSRGRPALAAETDKRDKGSFADHTGHHRNAEQSRPVLPLGVDRDRVTGHQPQRLNPQHSVRPDRPLEHFTPPVLNSADRTTTPTTTTTTADGAAASTTTTTIPGPQSVHEIHTFPAVRFFTTSQPPLRVKTDGGHPMRNQTQPFTSIHTREEEEERVRHGRERKEERDNSLSSLPAGNRGTFAMLQVERCCEVGRKWASEHHHCNHMPHANPADNDIMCSVVQEQCCSGALRQSRCLAGMSAARGGDACQAPPDGRICGEDSYQECCSCCALGLRLRKAGHGCHAHQYLDYPCGHILLTCCEEEGGVRGYEELPARYGPGGPLLKRKEMPLPTPMPKRVSDRKLPKEAFSVGGAGEDASSNLLEETETGGAGVGAGAGGGTGVGVGVGSAVEACQQYASHLCHHICINTWGSYRCGCHPGHVLLQDGHTCVPEDTEEDNRVREEEQQRKQHPVTQATSRLVTSSSPTTTSTTTTTTTSSTTTPTTKTTSQIPALLNPCAGNGPCAQRCSVAGGRAKCSCFTAYSLMADGRSCEDVDECLTNTHTCRASERCINTVGAFMCERQRSCSTGYQLRNGVCEDINECVLRTHNCGPGLECKNTDGSFSCVPKQRCYTGFTQDTHGNCIDIDECSTLAEACSSGFNCINTVGSYTCQRKVIMCSSGYTASPDGARCIDVDECQTGAHRCGEGQICQNIPGSYRCNCQTGYQYDAVRRTCVDVNECWRYPGRLCAQTCENTPGSYKCACTAGFSLAFDGKNCEDMNECDANPCSQECANIYGSYQCYCRQGFYLKEDGHTCEDIDECSQSIGHLCAFQCVNVPGSYQCACPPTGYSMSTNGRTCKDIDECAIGSHNCSMSESCFNIQGGFRCLSFACPSNYKKVSDTRCERVSCQNVADCQSSPLRITYYQLSFQTNIVIPAQIFRIGPSPAYAGDSITIGIVRGNEEGYFSTRRLNSFTGAVYLQRQVPEPRDFLVDVEMKLLRQGTFTSFLARIYVFITANAA
ncbi:uncharacterized protein fbln2 isoform X2 [Engraulis encrasicolus]|uniref:uncharacterized protein fbln2 isoform X2 n=1 Tax=Engraulis encrasicolus TaxID=184585 RepID=UPI002FD73C6A